MSLNDKKILIVDLEFAQNYKKEIKKASIMEIGMKKYYFNEKLIPDEEFTTLVNPQARVTPYVTSMTGIKNSDLKKMPTIVEIGIKVQEWIDWADILVFHGALGDVRALIYSGLNVNSKLMLDTQKMYRLVYPEQNYSSLTSIVESHELQYHEAHTAINDVEMTASVLSHLIVAIGELSKSEQRHINNCGIYQLKQRGLDMKLSFSLGIITCER